MNNSALIRQTSFNCKKNYTLQSKLYSCRLLMTGWKFAEYVLTHVHTGNKVCCKPGNVCVVQSFQPEHTAQLFSGIWHMEFRSQVWSCALQLHSKLDLPAEVSCTLSVLERGLVQQAASFALFEKLLLWSYICFDGEAFSVQFQVMLMHHSSLDKRSWSTTPVCRMLCNLQ